MKREQKNPDYFLIAAVVVLALIGLTMVSSASVAMAAQKMGDHYYYFKHQFFIGILGGGFLAFLTYKTDYHKWKRFAFPFLLLSLLSLAAVFVPGVGKNYGGASRWIKIGSQTFQPSELIKLIFIIYLAAWMSKDGEKVKKFKEGFLPFAALIGIISILIIKQPDVGTLGVIIFISVAMFFVAGAKLSYICSLFFAGCLSLWGLIKIAPYRMNRLLVFLNPGLDPKGIGYQIGQALLAIGSGGIFGLGLGYSRQKFNYLPEPIGDSVFAIIAEELGIIGTSCIIILFIFIAWRGFKIAKKTPDRFGRLLAAGITAWIIFQALMNIAAITSLMPLTGIPLPFISYGSSSLVMLMIGIGIMANISIS